MSDNPLDKKLRRADRESRVDQSNKYQPAIYTMHDEMGEPTNDLNLAKALSIKQPVVALGYTDRLVIRSIANYDYTKVYQSNSFLSLRFFSNTGPSFYGLLSREERDSLIDALIIARDFGDREVN